MELVRSTLKGKSRLDMFLEQSSFVPTRSVHGMTLLKKHESEPKSFVSHFWAFGSVVYSQIPDEKRKMNDKLKKCVLVGYSKISKG